MEPEGGADSAAARDSTATSAAATVASSTSRPSGLKPTEVTWAPGASHSWRTTGSCGWVVAQTTSAPSQAADHDGAARTGTSSPAPSSSASAAAFAGSRPATRTSANARTRVTAAAWARAWTPVPRMARVAASSRASRRVASADPAPVRRAVMAVPSSSASGRPSSGSKTAISAWCVGTPSALCGNSVTSLAASEPVAGVQPGIAASILRARPRRRPRGWAPRHGPR